MHLINNRQNGLISRIEPDRQRHGGLTPAFEQHQIALAGLGGGINRDKWCATGRILIIDLLHDHELDALQAFFFAAGNHVADHSGQLHGRFSCTNQMQVS